jgi:DNA-binding MarR family transcriptional regulator
MYIIESSTSNYFKPMKYAFSSTYLIPVEKLWQLFPEKELQGQYSNIPVGIVMIVLDKQKQGLELSLKELYSYFFCSHLTIKKFIDALCDAGYLQILKSKRDSRVKYLLMTEKCSVLCQPLIPKPPIS